MFAVTFSFDYVAATFRILFFGHVFYHSGYSFHCALKFGAITYISRPHKGFPDKTIWKRVGERACRVFTEHNEYNSVHNENIQNPYVNWDRERGEA